jgi:poly(3-hydroxybutyrate) depolymerase
MVRLLILGLVVLAAILGTIYLAEGQSGNKVDIITRDHPDAITGTASITTDNYANRKLRYYYFIPHSVVGETRRVPLLVAVPSLSGNGMQFVVGTGFTEFVEKNGFVMIAPTFIFDSKNWATKSSYQYPSAWSGDALVRMVGQFEKEHKISVSKYYLFGFSAGAQFSLRFCVSNPELCAACAAHSSGGTVTPKEYIDVKFFVSCGRQDSRMRQFNWFCDKASSLGIYVICKEYNGAHMLDMQKIEDSLQFFMSVWKEESSLAGNGD